ncbi:hypothetical protein GCM10017044_13850 [Kordiimonas sediminis]|uniref:DUF465 domain-containing protein n=1 Tax=Kordiimonas sediminis TaxID=1735581 RepID=A0A919AS34_9PROT|nr:DUF465 domain-containing protein [Kordiimonas sediminis]GHF20264.1 hypothetical protein GCM10017044_13850 [Kordiimonas sediminis]
MDDQAIQQRLSEVLEEHRDLDDAIQSMMSVGTFDHLQVQRLKKRKLILKDQISKLEDMLLPDIIA